MIGSAYGSRTVSWYCLFTLAFQLVPIDSQRDALENTRLADGYSCVDLDCLDVVVVAQVLSQLLVHLYINMRD